MNTSTAQLLVDDTVSDIMDFIDNCVPYPATCAWWRGYAGGVHTTINAVVDGVDFTELDKMVKFLIKIEGENS